MAQKINVNRNVQDPFYRYKMPRIVAKVEGKGNGIKTVIANMPEIAKALSRPPTCMSIYSYFHFHNLLLIQIQPNILDVNSAPKPTLI